MPVITKCIEVNVDRRYASAKELLSALEALSSDAKSYAKRNGALSKVILGILAVCALLGGVLFAVSRPDENRNGDAAQEQQPHVPEKIVDESTAETPPSEELIDLQPGQWSGQFGDDGTPIADPMRFAYDLDGDGETENYIFGTSLHNDNLSSVLVIGDEVNLKDASGTVRIPVPSVWRVMDDGQFELAPEFAELLTDAVIKVWRGTNLDAPAPKIIPYDCEWQGGLRIEYTREHLGTWVYETTATLEGRELRSVSKTMLVLPN